MSHLKGTAKTQMQEQMEDHSELFQNGGVFVCRRLFGHARTSSCRLQARSLFQGTRALKNFFGEQI
eukprot:10986616-Prorocentrum_lima.AAC.1